MTDREEIRKIEDVLCKYFRDGTRNLYFHGTDDYYSLAGDPYLKYSYFGGSKGIVIISIGGKNIDETPIKVCSKAEQIENLIKAIIY